MSQGNVRLPDDPTFHILLLPRENYWAWVGAARDYAVRFGVNITPLPDNAVHFHPPNQSITVITYPEAYPEYGDIVAWLTIQAPEARIDTLKVRTPDDLNQLLLQRVKSGSRFRGVSSVSPAVPPPTPLLTLIWPTDYPKIVQGFGEAPDIYRRWGLPGHEGVDLQAPLNGNVYACADGYVYQVNDGTGGHPYGVHVRIRHADSYSTTYAHLNRALVHEGQDVKAGELIALADSTGNSTGHYLHLTLKKEGATEAGLTMFPRDIIDPTPYLVFPADRRPPAPPTKLWDYDHCLVGLHGRVDGPMQEADWAVVRQARIEALKLTSSASPEEIDRALQINPNMFVIVRLFADFNNRVVEASEFVRWVEYDMQRFYDRGVRYFEVHNEPNLAPEGYGSSWHSGREFGEWMLHVIGLLRPSFPDAKFGWPGLSPGPTEGMRVDHLAFLESAGTLVSQADWIGVHCYWQTEDALFAREGGLIYDIYRSRWPDKLVLITEFSNTAPGVDWQVKGNQYLRYYTHLCGQPGLGAAFAFVVSSSANFPYETWRFEDGTSPAIAGIVGSRNF